MKILVRFGTIAALTLMTGAVCFGQHYTQTNLVSSTSGVAPVTDPQLINPWGLSRGSGTATSAGEDRERFHFRTVTFPNDTFTQLLGINDEEMIAGYHGAASNVGFVFSFRNNFTL